MGNNRPQLVQGHEPGIHQWERQNFDTDKAFEAFETYRLMGSTRSLSKLSKQLGKNASLLERWSKRDNWQARILAWDRHEARVINEKITIGTASMRERQVMLAMQMQARAQKRMLSMSEAELELMRPVDVCAIMRTASEMERRARDIPEGDEQMPEVVPKFEIQIIRPAQGMVPVQLAGRYGYIPASEVERFRHDNPEAVVIC